jgi:hypothetical protein
MQRNNSTGGFTKIASVAMQTLDKRSFFDGAGRNVTVVPNSLDLVIYSNSELWELNLYVVHMLIQLSPDNVSQVLLVRPLLS